MWQVAVYDPENGELDIWPESLAKIRGLFKGKNKPRKRGLVLLGVWTNPAT